MNFKLLLTVSDIRNQNAFRFYDMLKRHLAFLLFLLLSNLAIAQEDQFILNKVNEIREQGCRCGHLRMPAVSPVTWNDQLEYSALLHARDMKRHNYFGHYSKKGMDVGARVEKIGYKWLVVGENLGEGQRSFEEVLEDWIKSQSHCEMLMDPRVTEMGVAKFDKYWVQHFGKPADPDKELVRHNRKRRKQ